jgi:class 3 adenylate cyclase
MLRASGRAGEILVGDLTYRLVRKMIEADPVEPLALKGKPSRVPAHRLVALLQEVASGRRELLWSVASAS